MSLPLLIPEHVCTRLDEAIIGSGVPVQIREGLLCYLKHGRPTGHFLEAVLSNDLAEACRRADPVCALALSRIVSYLDCHAPSMAWGSREAVRAWFEAGAEARRAAAVESEAR